jgi:hypothetical protein
MKNRYSPTPPTNWENLLVEPLSQQNWAHFEKLFGERGACGSCWCMANRLQRKQFVAGQKANTNKKAMRNLVTGGKPAGLIGFISCLFIARKYQNQSNGATR